MSTTTVGMFQQADTSTTSIREKRFFDLYGAHHSKKEENLAMITINSREEEDERPQLETLSRLGLKILAQGGKNGG